MRFLTVLLLLLSPAFGLAQGKGYKPLTPEVRAKLYAERREAHGGRMQMLRMNQALPAAFDCRDKGWVIPVGDQANCGSCYLYSTVYGTLTQAFVKAGYGKPDMSFLMSVQFGMDCHDFGGCDGGNGTEVIDWIARNGFPAETYIDMMGKVMKDYPPYEARSRACREVAGAKRWKPATWGFATGGQTNRAATTAEIKTALFNYGPLNVSLDAGGQFGNGTGTITSLGRNIDHEIELVAWDDAKGAFLLKNQWGTSWGNGGYRWATYAACGNLVDVFWVSVSPLPPPPPPPPPDPPGPGPLPSGVTITISKDLKAGSYEIHPGGTKAKLDAIQALIEELRLLNKTEGPPVIEEKAPPIVEKKTTWEEKKWYDAGETVCVNGACYTATYINYNSPPRLLAAWRQGARR